MGTIESSPMERFGAPGLAFTALTLAFWACGDLDDVSVPLIPEPRAPMSAPRFNPSPAAAAVIAIDEGAGGTCGAAVSIAVPASAARAMDARELRQSLGEQGAGARCSVRARAGAPELFDVDASLIDEGLPRFIVWGAMSELAPTSVTLQVTTRDGVRVDADCGVDVVEVDAGAASFRLTGCSGRLNEGAVDGCRVDVLAAFEHCSGAGE